MIKKSACHVIKILLQNATKQIYTKVVIFWYMSIIETPWEPFLEDFLSSAKTDIMVATPFFSSAVIRKILEEGRRDIKIRILLGKLTTQTVSEGSTDHLALKLILSQHNNVKCKCIENLHAKVLITDSFTENPRAIITSSNLTKEGLLNNIEFGILVEKSLAREITKRLARYWDDPKAEPLSLDKIAPLLNESSKTENKRVSSLALFSLGRYILPKGENLKKIFIAEHTVRDAIKELRQMHGVFNRKKERKIRSAQSLLRKLLNRDLSMTEFKEILNTINDETGALRIVNIKHLLKNDINKVNRSLTMLLDESKPLDSRVDLALYGKHKLSGGAMGFVSAMLFINDGERYNLYNRSVLEGLRRNSVQMSQQHTMALHMNPLTQRFYNLKHTLI